VVGFQVPARIGKGLETVGQVPKLVTDTVLLETATRLETSTMQPHCVPRENCKLPPQSLFPFLVPGRGSGLSAHCFFGNPQPACEVAVVGHRSQLRELRLQEIRQLAQDHTAHMW
jgi:hypothetical protein